VKAQTLDGASEHVIFVNQVSEPSFGTKPKLNYLEHFKQTLVAEIRAGELPKYRNLLAYTKIIKKANIKRT
jgi:hypothetical protein